MLVAPVSAGQDVNHNGVFEQTACRFKVPEAKGVFLAMTKKSKATEKRLEAASC